MKAIINTLPNCPWCEKAKRLMTLKNIQYKTLEGKSDDWPTVPYIVIDGQPIGGFAEFAAWCRKN